MKIVVFTGGSGSKALQEGLNLMYGDTLDLHLVTNAYDNGLSTGVVRKVANGRILGPSDLRKNQFLQLGLFLKDNRRTMTHSFYKELLSFMDLRISVASPIDAYDYIMSNLNKLSATSTYFKSFDIIKSAIDTFFKMDLANKVDYIDFSIANIIYAGMAIERGYSLEQAGISMIKNVFNSLIPIDRVLLSSDENLYLTAVTQSGRIIYDEGDIVKWNNPNDKIVDIELVDENGKVQVPILSSEVRKVMQDADIIVFSCGTEWSSLIPTYKHKLFKETLDETKAKLYLVMNNVPDKDMTDVNSKDMLETLVPYLPSEKITVIMNVNSDERMKYKSDSFKRYITDKALSLKGSKTHDPVALSSILIQDYLNDYISREISVFDFDGTVVGRGNSMMDDSDINLDIIARNPEICILSGNSFNRIEMRIKKLGESFLNRMYCDGGNSLYTWDSVEKCYKFRKYIDESLVLGKDEIKKIYDSIMSIGIKFPMIENRNNMIVSIKPVESNTRESKVESLKNLLGFEYTVLATGRTTIDIMKKNYDKSVIFKDKDIDGKTMLYVGDELEHGNDAIMKHNKNVKYYAVKNPKDTYHILKHLDNATKRIYKRQYDYLISEESEKYQQGQSACSSKSGHSEFHPGGTLVSHCNPVIYSSYNILNE